MEYLIRVITLNPSQKFLSIIIHIRKQIEISTFRWQYIDLLHIIHYLSAVLTEDLSRGSGSAATLPTPGDQLWRPASGLLLHTNSSNCSTAQSESLHNERHTLAPTPAKCVSVWHHRVLTEKHGFWNKARRRGRFRYNSSQKQVHREVRINAKLLHSCSRQSQYHRRT